MDLIHLRIHCSNSISIVLTDATITSIAVLRVENGLYNCTITSANGINSTSALTNAVQVTNAPNACTSKYFKELTKQHYEMSFIIVDTPTIQGSACGKTIIVNKCLTILQ